MEYESDPQTTWPGVKLAYDFVLPSYQWAITRFEAVDSRIQTLQAFIVTVILRLPTLATLIFRNIPFTSWWFIMACSLAMIAIMIGVIGRSWGGITLVHPQVLYEKWLHRQEWECRKDMVYFAAEHFEQNSNLVNRKGRLVTIMTILFLVEAGLLFVWVISARR
ncbi:MAG: hypothetical protein ACRERE_16925 [Candidatus Entotheonellia bacterium]